MHISRRGHPGLRLTRFIGLLFLLALFTLSMSGTLSAAHATTSLTPAHSALAPVNRYSPGGTYASLVAGIHQLEEQHAQYKDQKTFENLAEIRYTFSRLRSLLDLSEIPPANRVKAGNAAITYLADILARLSAVDIDTIPGALPGESDLPPRWTIPGTDIQIARVQSGPHAGEYLFTAQSIHHLQEYMLRLVDHAPIQPRRYPRMRLEHIHATGPLFPDAIVDRIPESLKAIHLNTPIWKMIAITLVGLFVILMAYGWSRLIARRSRHGSALQRLAWRFTMPMCLLVLYFVSVWFVIDHINPSGVFAQAEVLLTTAFLYGVSAWAAWIASFLLVEVIIHSPKVASNSFDAHLLRLTARIFAIGSSGGILIYGANEMGIPALGLVAGVGAGGFALALASQSTIENLFGGLSLFADRPFRIGETISFGSERGTVEMVGSRSSRIRALDGTLVTVPNSDLAKMQIINLTRRNRCLMQQTICLRNNTPIDKVDTLLATIRSLVASHAMVEQGKGTPRVRLIGMAPGQLDIEVRAQVPTDDYSRFLAVQEELLLDILRSIETMGIELARPQPAVN
ncbi:mechanosensitive ion channel family protein [Orrella marina]|nr:mechanosensitive ion channel domain-containing protein [Orrella marina]